MTTDKIYTPVFSVASSGIGATSAALALPSFTRRLIAARSMVTYDFVVPIPVSITNTSSLILAILPWIPPI